MTISVTITHKMPGYDKAVTVEEVDLDVNGNPIPKHLDHYKHVVQPGGTSRELYIWGGRGLLITEGPVVPPEPKVE